MEKDIWWLEILQQQFKFISRSEKEICQLVKIVLQEFCMKMAFCSNRTSTTI